MILSKHCTITATLRRFSSCVEDSASTEYDCDADSFRDHFKVRVYVNGSCAENEGHVSIVFEANYPWYLIVKNRMTFSCTASVIDASGNKRFPQSIAVNIYYLYKEDRLFFTNKGFGFDRFLKRSTLLDDPSELLSDDCLTLCLDIDYEVFFPVNTFSMLDGDAFVMENGCSYLRMDSKFGRELCKLSSVFRDMMECTTVEGGPDWIPISDEEWDSFQLICYSLCEFSLNVGLPDIYKAYLTADKYDMQPVIRLCHQLLVSMVRAMNTEEQLEDVDKDMHLISDLAERFEDDESLREILAIYSDMKKKVAGRSGGLDAWKLDTGWRCDYSGKNGWSALFQFPVNKSENIEIDIYK